MKIDDSVFITIVVSGTDLQMHRFIDVFNQRLNDRKIEFRFIEEHLTVLVSKLGKKLFELRLMLNRETVAIFYIKTKLAKDTLSYVTDYEKNANVFQQIFVDETNYSTLYDQLDSLISKASLFKAYKTFKILHQGKDITMSEAISRQLSVENTDKIVFTSDWAGQDIIENVFRTKYAKTRKAKSNQAAKKKQVSENLND